MPTRDLAQRFISVCQTCSTRRRPCCASVCSTKPVQQHLDPAIGQDPQGLQRHHRVLQPLLIERAQKFGQTPDVVKTHLYHLRTSSPVDAQPLVTAMRNFEANESFDEVSLQETSALAQRVRWKVNADRDR